MSEKINLAKLKKEGETFEIVVDPDAAIDFKKGRITDLGSVLKSDEIFSDAKKGMLASTTKMKQLFQTEENEEVAKIILKTGEIQLSAEYRAKLVEDKRKRIVNTIHQNGVDPKTNLPHPVTRIENAFEEAKVKIDPQESEDKQVKEILKKLTTVLPIKFVTKEIHVRIPSQFAGKAYSTVANYSTIKKEDWLSDGSWAVTVEIPGGMETEFYEKISSVCQGDYDAKLLNIK